MSEACAQVRTRRLRGGVVHEAIWAPLAVLGFVLLLLGTTDGGSVLAGPCFFKTWTTLPCLTCGGTRALRALTELEIVQAFAWNPLVALAGCVAAVYVVHALRVLLVTRTPWRPRPLARNAAFAVRATAIAAVLLNWGYLFAVGR